jgi:hypothetical protein
MSERRGMVGGMDGLTHMTKRKGRHDCCWHRLTGQRGVGCVVVVRLARPRCAFACAFAGLSCLCTFCGTHARLLGDVSVSVAAGPEIPKLRSSEMPSTEHVSTERWLSARVSISLEILSVRCVLVNVKVCVDVPQQCSPPECRWRQ